MTEAVHRLPCPSCQGGALTPSLDPVTSCDLCGHGAHTQHVAETIALATYLRVAQTRYDWLLTQVDAGTSALAPTTAAPVVPDGPGRQGSAARRSLFALGGALLGLAGVFFLALAWSALPLPGRAGLILAASGALIGAGHHLADRLRATAETFTSVGTILAVAAWVAAPDLFNIARHWSDGTRSLWYGAVLLIASATTSIATMRSPLRAWPLLTAAAVIAAGADATIGISEHGHWWLVSTVAGVIGGLFYLAPPPLPRATVRLDVDRFLLNGQSGRLLKTAGICHLTAAALIAFVGLFTSHRLASAATILMLSCAPTVIVHFKPHRKQRHHAFLILSAGAGVSASVAAVEFFHAHAATVLTVTALGALAVLARSARTPNSLVPFITVAGATGIVLTQTQPGPLSTPVALAGLAVTLTLTGLTGTTRSLPWRHGRWAAAAAASAAWWTWAGSQHLHMTVEGWTAPAAAFTLIAGTLWARQENHTPRWHHTDRWLLPGLLALLIPGALTAMTEIVTATNTDLNWRAPTYLMAGAILSALGGRARLSARLKAGTATVIFASIGQVTTIGRALPGWVALALAGAVVLTAAIRWEWQHNQSRRSKDWSNSLR